MMKNWREGIRTIEYVWMAMVGAFCIIQLTWYWGIKIRYDDAIQDMYAKHAARDGNMGKGKAGDGMYEILKDGYRYRVNETKYLQNSGSACICTENRWAEGSGKPEGIAAQGGTKVNLNIGFKLFCNYSYQVEIENTEGSYQVEVDRFGNLLMNGYMDSQSKEKINQVLEQSKEEINCLFYHANEIWEIQ